VPRGRRAAVRRSVGGSMHFIPATSALRPSGAHPPAKSLYRGHAPTQAARASGRGAAIHPWCCAIYICQIRAPPRQCASPSQIAVPGGGPAIARRLRRVSRGNVADVAVLKYQRETCSSCLAKNWPVLSAPILREDETLYLKKCP